MVAVANGGTAKGSANRSPPQSFTIEVESD